MKKSKEPPAWKRRPSITVVCRACREVYPLGYNCCPDCGRALKKRCTIRADCRGFRAILSADMKIHMKSTALFVFLTLATLTAAQTKAKAIPKSRTISHYMQQIGLLYVETDNDLNDAEYAVGEDRNEARIESLKISRPHQRSTRIEVKDGTADAVFLDDLLHLRTKRKMWGRSECLSR